MAEYRDPTPIDPNKDYQITELADFIRTKMDGHDVREALALGLERAYEDAATSGNANMEVAQARGSYPTLARRLLELDEIDKEVTAQLAQKITKNRGDVDTPDLSQNVKEIINGDRPLPAAEVDSILTENIVDGQVTPKKTSFIELGKNKWDGTHIKGIAVSFDGEVIAEGQNVGGAVIKIKNNETYFVSAFEGADRFRIALLDRYPKTEDLPVQPLKQMIVDNNLPTPVKREITNDVGAEYLFVFTTSSDGYFPKIMVTLENHYEYQEPSYKFNHMADGSVEWEHLDNNLKDNLTTGKYPVHFTEIDALQVSTGAHWPANDRVRTDYIYVTKGSRIEFIGQENDPMDSFYVIQYTKDSKEFMGNSYKYVHQYDVEEDCYVRLISRYSDERVITDTEPFNNRVVINTHYDMGNPVPTPKLFGDFNRLYRSSDFVSLNESEIDNLTTEDMHTMYADLVNQFPNIMGSEQLGYATDSSGGEDTSRPINEYIIQNPKTSHRNLPNVSPTILIVTGLHGNEKVSAYSGYLFLKKLLTEWYDDDSLASIKGNCIIKVVPVANPWGFDNDIRFNARDVDLNRNFTHGWEDSTEQKGDTPLSENESQILSSWMADNLNAIGLIDFHNTSESYGTSYLVSNNPQLREIYSSVIRRLSDYWWHKYGIDSDNISYGWVISNDSSYLATEAYEVHDLKKSSILEVAWDFEGTMHGKEAVERGVDLLGNHLLSMLNLLTSEGSE